LVSAATPVNIVNAALAALSAILDIIAHIRSQSGLSDEQIYQQALASVPANAELIKNLLNSIPQS